MPSKLHSFRDVGKSLLSSDSGTAYFSYVGTSGGVASENSSLGCVNSLRGNLDPCKALSHLSTYRGTLKSRSVISVRMSRRWM